MSNIRKILTSALTIGVVGAVVLGVSSAFFSGSQTSENNIIKAGDIELDVDTGDSDQFLAISIDDLKPSYVRWTKHTIRNTGSNPLKLYKKLTNVATHEHGTNKSERDYYKTNNIGEEGKNDIDHYIEYDIYLEGQVLGEEGQPTPSPENNWWGGHNEGGQVVISEDAGIRVSDIEDIYVYLGELAPAGDEDDSVVVWQSYHMVDETENWAQTDTMTFDIQFLGLQLNADNPESATVGGEGRHAILLENKNYEGDYNPILDEIWGSFSWAGDGDVLDFSSTLMATGLTPGVEYSLIYFADPWPGDHPGALITTAVADGSGNIFKQDSVDLNLDLPTAPDTNAPGAKLWLIPSADYDGAHALVDWNPASYLFEYALMSYDDTDI